MRSASKRDPSPAQEYGHQPNFVSLDQGFDPSLWECVRRVGTDSFLQVETGRLTPRPVEPLFCCTALQLDLPFKLPPSESCCVLTEMRGETLMIFPSGGKKNVRGWIEA